MKQVCMPGNGGGTDSGWKTNGSIKYRKIGEIVYVLIPNGKSGTTYTTIGTLPAGYRPATTMYYYSPATITGTVTAIQIQTGGDVLLAVSTSSTSSVPSTISFPVG